MKRVCGRARCAIGVAQIYESRVVGARMCDRGHSKWTHHKTQYYASQSAQFGIKATILDRGHSKQLSRGVESHFAAQGTIRIDFAGFCPDPAQTPLGRLHALF